MKWIAVEKELPKIGQNVLCFFVAGKTSIHVVGKIDEIVTVEYGEGRANRSVYWINDNGDSILPSHWVKIDSPLDNPQDVPALDKE